MSIITWAEHKWAVRKAERDCERLRHERIVDNVQAQKKFKKMMEISPILVERMAEAIGTGKSVAGIMPVPEYKRTPYVPPVKNLICQDLHVSKTIAKDSMFSGAFTSEGGGPAFFTGMGFPGFPYLTELTEITEYRDMSCRVAAEMCRKWIEFRTEGGSKKRDKQIAIIKAEMKRLGVREKFLEAAEKDGFFGRCQIFMDFGQTDGKELGYPILLNPYSVRKDSLRALKIIEPITTYPAVYNSSWPLKQDYYVPSSWWVYGQEVSASRLLTFVSRPLPDLLKPVFNFSGISLSQLAEPYVNYWLNTRDSVGRLLKNFSASVLKTNMEGVLQGQNNDAFLARAQMYNALRDNQGILLLDKETEEFEKHETSLSGLDKLQAQAQEHMAAVAKTPLVILLGITPSGLNASDEQGLRIFYDYVNDQQERLFRVNLEKIIRVIQLSKFGEIYEDIAFDFVSLMSMTEKEHALIRKSNAEEAQIFIANGVVTNTEVREKIAADPDSGWGNLDVDKPEGELLDPSAAQQKGGAAGGNSMKAENAQATNAEFNS
jgi:phage-related protein (TIGR01555 family)